MQSLIQQIKNRIEDILGYQYCYCNVVFPNEESIDYEELNKRCYPCSIKEDILFGAVNCIRGTLDKKLFLKLLKHVCNLNDLNIAEFMSFVNSVDQQDVKTESPEVFVDSNNWLHHNQDSLIKILKELGIESDKPKQNNT